MIAPAFPRPRKPRGRAPLRFEVTTRYHLVPVAEFVRGWAPVIARTAARLAATSTVLLAGVALGGCGHHQSAPAQQQPLFAPAIGPVTTPVAPSAAG